MIKAVIFDLCGVCFMDFGIGGKVSGKKYARLLPISSEEFKKIWKTAWSSYKLGKITESEFWKIFIKKFNTKAEIEDLKRITREGIKLKLDVIKIVKKLKENYTIAMITNNSIEWVDYINRKYGLNKIFDLIVNSADVCMAKPDPEIYEFTLKKLNLKPEECIFIDDLERNIRSAKDLGMKTILFESAKKLKSELSKFGVKING